MWFLFSFGAAVFDASRDAIGKNALQRVNLGPFTVSWGLTFFGALFISPLVLIYGTPQIETNAFWVALLMAAFIHVFATANYFKAIKIADLSLAGPITSFTPLFLLVLSPLFSLIYGQNAARELPNPIGIIGVVLVVAGSYIINYKEKQRGYLAPLKVLFTDKGSRMVLISAFCWSVTISLDKVAMGSLTADNPFQKAFFWGTLLLSHVALFTLPFVFWENVKGSPSPKSAGKPGSKKLKSMLQETVNRPHHQRRPRLQKAAQIWYRWKTWIGFGQTKPPDLYTSRTDEKKLSVMLSPYKKPQQSAQIRSRVSTLVGIGLSDALITICHMMAVNLAVAAYAIAVKRLAIIFKVLFGYFLFGERNLEERIVGATIMVIGVICISCANLIWSIVLSG